MKLRVKCVVYQKSTKKTLKEQQNIFIEDAFILGYLISFSFSTNFRGLGKLDCAYGIRVTKAVVSEKLWVVISKLGTCVTKFFFSMRRGSQDCAEILQQN